MRDGVAMASAALLAASASASALGGGDFPSFEEASASTGIVGDHEPSFQFLISNIPIAPMTSGGAVADFNRDGFSDVFMIGGGAEPDRLFINDPNAPGHFTDQAVAWGLGQPHMGLGAAAGDFNNDGWIDLFVTSVGPHGAPPSIGKHKLYRNNGNGTFTNIATSAGVNQVSTIIDGMGAAFGDYDLDGDLDLFVCGWVPNTNSNRLFRNNGNETFTDVTVAAGLFMPTVRGFAPRFVDMDGDRYPELLVAADFLTSRYYVNNGDGTFTNATAASHTGLDGNGMGQTVGDFNHDGVLDWYVTSIHNAAPIPPNVPGTGNMLYLGQGEHVFCEASGANVPPGDGCAPDANWHCNDGGWGWGTAAADINHDTFEDIVETNGWFQHPQFVDEMCYVYLNLGDDFVNVAATCGFTHNLMGRGLVNLDLENDGDQDFVVFANLDAVQVYRNSLVTAHHWVRAFLDTSANPRLAPDGFGTRVIARFTDSAQGTIERTRYLSGGNNFQSTG
ncbi:MAG: VCBS repeat-containing protein, partial [Phycisphaerales bacterium]|nr:VCBS repeat-containing protein [Phycisphaerales bacterium]